MSKLSCLSSLLYYFVYESKNIGLISPTLDIFYGMAFYDVEIGDYC